MYKSLIWFSVMALVSVTLSISFAQTFSFTTPEPASKNPTSPTIRKPFSAEEFRKNIKTVSQKNDAALSQQVNKMVKPALPRARPPQPTGGTKLLPPPRTQNIGTPANTGEANPAPQPTTSTQSNLPIPSNTTPPAPSQPTYQPSQQQTQIYTGFPSGNGSTGGTTNQSSPSGGAWNLY